MIVSFDLDGVLMENPFITGIFPYIKKELKNQYQNHHNQSIKEDLIWENIKFEFSRRIKANLYNAYDWDDIIQTVADDLKVPGEIDITKLNNKYFKKPYIHLYKNGKNLLDKLIKSDITLFVVTNGYYKYQFPVMKALGIEGYFKEIITADKRKSVKPESKIFSSELKESDNWFHIGDSLLMDIYGANKLSATTILVYRDLSEDLLKLSPAERVNAESFKEFMNEKLSDELSLNRWEYEEKLIFPDYVVKSLKEIFPILI
ncbi:MAG: HAD family hydrolase [Halarsenatibacteraceae bacterium]